MAKKFYEMGYQTAVVTYTTNLLQMNPLKLQPMQDLMRAIRYIRKHAEELHVEKNDGTFPVPEDAKQVLNEMAKMFTGQTTREKEQANEEVKQWPELADEWIQEMF